MPADVTPRASAAALAADVGRVNSAGVEDPIDLVVIGLPRRLGGEDNDETPAAREFAAAFQQASGLNTIWQDERLTSLEADQRLAERERDWRRRKGKLDAAAAAIILQDYLDQENRARTARAIE